MINTAYNLVPVTQREQVFDSISRPEDMGALMLAPGSSLPAVGAHPNHGSGRGERKHPLKVRERM